MQPREVMLTSAPKYAAVLIANNYLDCQISEESPIGTPVIAYTTFEEDRRCWVINFHPAALELSTNAREYLWRHELGHIAFNHFKEVNCRPDNEGLGTQESLIVSDTQINYYLLEERHLMEEIGNKVREMYDNIGQPIQGPGFVDPEEVLPKIGLAIDEYSYEVIHGHYHQMVDDMQNKPEEGNSYCGGIQSLDTEAMASTAAVISNVLSTSNDEAFKGIGDNNSNSYLSIPKSSTPEWLKHVEKFARSIVKTNLAPKRSHTKPSFVHRQFNIHMPTKKPKWNHVPQQVCFLVDTSGSMLHNLKYVVPVIHYLNANNISVRLIAGDTIVTTDEEYKPGSKLFSEIKGGGGTEITPLFDRAAEYNPASIVCFTDGWVPRWPRNTGIPTLWVGTDRTPPFGIVAK